MTTEEYSDIANMYGLLLRCSHYLCTGKDEFWGGRIDPQSVEHMFTQPARWGSWAPVLPHGGTDEGALALEDILHCFAAKGRKPPVPWGLQTSWSYFTHCEDL